MARARTASGGGEAARVYSVPPDAPFLDTLAAAVLSGELPAPGGAAPGPMELPRWTILLPTRRAARALREAFLKVTGGKALLLPAIRPVGDVDEDAASLTPPPETPGDGLALELPDAIGAVERQLVLTELVLAWSRAARTETPATTPGQAARWAADLSALMDSAETEGVDFSALDSLVGGDHAAHWRLTLDFLGILTESWPAILRDRGQLSPYGRRDRLMRAAVERLKAEPPDAPVIAAGSTGTVPATAALLETIARLPLGAVVLPGLDMSLDDESWQSITDGSGHPEHPQYGMKLLLDTMGVARVDVVPLGGGPEPAPRPVLISEVMRPAGSTGLWRAYAEGETPERAATALAGITRIDAATAQDEAEAVSLILRRVADEAPKTAALVTPDRTLARRVSARLSKWNLTVDDSAGQPLARTPPGTLMDLALEAAAENFSAVPLMAMLKHPLARLGRDAGAIRAEARSLELGALRRPFAGNGFAALRKQLARTGDEQAGGNLRHTVLRRHRAGDWQSAGALLDDVEMAFAGLTALFGDDALPVHLGKYAEAHLAAARALARDGSGSDGELWRGDAGEALSLFFAELLSLSEAGPEIAGQDYVELYRVLMAGRPVRPRAPSHPRLFIWGPLEARLQRPDVVVLGGLNEETWPSVEDTGPWLSRPMLEKLGLPPPERRIGLAAHDMAQLMGADEVYLTRAEKVDGAPAVPSRWLLRLQAILEAAGCEKCIERGDWLGWAVQRDQVSPAPPLQQPAPCPPLDARPKKLSVTQIEAWIANPYAIFARQILALEKLDPLAAAPGAAMRGTLMHEALSAFARAHPDRLPADIASELMRHARAAFAALSGDTVAEAFWRPQLANFSLWFAATEPKRREDVSRVHDEIRGELQVPGCAFTLTARADRIDLRGDGALAIYDYKTGGVPSAKQVAEGFAPQLPLEAAIAAAGGFEGLEAAPAAVLGYIRILGRGDGGEAIDAGGSDPEALAGDALDALARLVATYARPEQEYRALRRARFDYRYDEYAHLARVAEWSAGNGGEGS